MASLDQYNGTLGKEKAAHLLRRATYRATSSNIEYFKSRTASQAVDEIVSIQPLSIMGPVDYQDPSKSFIETKNFPADPGEWILRHYVKSWWIDEALKDDSISHKMEFFLHSNFVASNNSMDPFEYHDYLKLNRHFALGSIKELAKRMSVNIVMMYYLDGNDNHKDAPNENYGREFLELFSIGKGPQEGPGNYTYYTEEDVQAAARVFTGWRTWDEERVIYNTEIGVLEAFPANYAHDKDDKVFSSAFGNQTITGQEEEENFFQEIDDFVEMVFAQIATARNICRKLYRYFVSSSITPEIESDIIEPLADTLFANDYVLEPAIKQLLKSQHFFDADDTVQGDEIIGSMLKSPIDLLAHTLNFFDTPIPDRYSDYENHYRRFYLQTVQDNLFEKASFKIFEPPSVAGYAALYQEPLFYKLRMTSNTIVARYKLPEIVLQGKNLLTWGGPSGASAFDIINFIDSSSAISDPSSASGIVSDLTNYLFPKSPSSERMSYFLNDVFLQDLPEMDWYIDWLTYKGNGDESLVKSPLERLFIALISSQEFQLM